MAIFWAITSILTAVLAVDFVYRRIVSGRISNLIEDVPLFGVVEVGSPSLDRSLQIPVGDGQELAACLYPAIDVCRGVIIFCPELNGGATSCTGN